MAQLLFIVLYNRMMFNNYAEPFGIGQASKRLNGAQTKWRPIEPYCPSFIQHNTSELLN